MSSLVIVESPAKAKTIEKYLGSGYTVKASVGHVRDLPKSNKNAIDIAKGFVPHYEVSHGKEKVLKELKAAATKADEVLLATDPDREGEAIAWHLFEALQLDPKHTKRVAFNEITKDAVQAAIAHPREIDQHLRKAQEARRVLDRLVGYDLSGLIWKKVRYGLSAGRVQSPALRILMEREREIRAFVPEAYWVITADLTPKNSGRNVTSGAGAKAHENSNTLLTFTCTEEPNTEQEADRIVQLGKNAAWQVAKVTEQQRSRSPYPPFTTSTLQQAASTRLGFSPSRTMALAQKLYEAGHITYMRTDSPTLSTQALGHIASVIEKEYSKAEVAIKQFKSKSKNAQEAHEAIRPTSVSKKTAGTTDEQKRLYVLIRTRTISSQMRAASILRTTVTANADADIPPFSITGSQVLTPGWLLCDTAARGEDVELPRLEEKEALTCAHIEHEGKETTPPKRYTEAGLVKELEKRGIGRPSTYASIMRNIIDREYVEKQGKTLIPTATGDVVSTFLEEHFPTYISDTFTAEMEEKLDDIAAGTRKYETTLSEFYTPFHTDVESKEDIAKLTTLGDVADNIRCPLCDATMVYKLARGGKFMSCSRFPECEGARTEDGRVVEADTPLGTYPETGEPIFVLEGRFGPYVQVGDPKEKRAKGAPKPRRASIPQGKDPSEVTLDEALHYLSLPRTLGTHPETGEEIVANIGRFGPYIVHQKDFRSLKEDDVYTISLERALAILKEPKKQRGWGRKKVGRK
jgi:DNA topoisomerase I